METASPSMPTGIRSDPAVTTTSREVSTRKPVPCRPRSKPTACHTLSAVTATTPSTPRSSRARRPRPAMSPVPYGLLATSSACGASIVTPSAFAASRAPRLP